MIISLAGNDVTKAKHILYNESLANLMLYMKAISHHDDIEEQKVKEDVLPKNGTVKTDIRGFFSLMKQLKQNE